jgi:acetyl esterase/lipase
MPVDRGVVRAWPVPPLADEMRARLQIDERVAAGVDGPEVRLVVYRPIAMTEVLPIVLSIHGGAFCFGRPEDFETVDAAMALSVGAVVVAVDYRLAPEHPFPAGIDDCWAALLWTVANAGELGIDADRLAVTGASAGGALAAALCLMTRDRGGPKVAYQALFIPCIDDRLATPSIRQAVDNPGFNSKAAEGMWLHYLGEELPRPNTSPYAAPGRATSLAGLPPAFVLTGGLDPLRDEGLGYAMALLADGVQAELHNVPGMYHGAPELDTSALARGRSTFTAAISDALNRDR